MTVTDYAHRTLLSPTARWLSQLHQPLYRTGYALNLSSMATSVIGMLYWAIAAHRYPAETLGIDSAALSAMQMIAGMSQLNLSSAVLRFLPIAGGKTPSRLRYAYLVSALIAAVVSISFLAGIPIWAPRLGFLHGSIVFLFWFTVATMAWTTFVLQDAALTAVGQAIWVPIENAAFSIVKVGLVILLASRDGHGIFVSWTIAVGLTLVPTNVFLFRRAIPRHLRCRPLQMAPPPLRQVGRYVAGDYVGALSWLLCTTTLPLIVLYLLGARATAAFALAWVIAYSLFLVGANMGSSVVVQAALDEAKLHSFSRGVLRHTLAVLAPVALFIVAVAPQLLRLFGTSYAIDGAGLLRLLVLASLPNLATALFISEARVRRRMTTVVAIQVSLCVLVLVSSCLLIPYLGINGVGFAWLGSQTLVAGVLFGRQARSSHCGYRLVIATSLLAGGVARRLGVTAYAGRRRSRAVGTRAKDDLMGLLPDVLAMVPGLLDVWPGGWVVQKMHATVSDLTVAYVGPAGSSAQAVAKLANKQDAIESLRRQSLLLPCLRQDSRLAGWCHLLPEVLAQGQLGNWTYGVESILFGRDGTNFLSSPLIRERMTAAAAVAIGELHRRTSRLVVLDSEAIATLVDEPLDIVKWRYLRPHGTAFGGQALDALREQLRANLIGRVVEVSWVHGDYSLGNVLFANHGQNVSGIVDWSSARPDGLPLVDVLHLLLSTRALVTRQELGVVVRDTLRRGRWPRHEQQVLAEARSQSHGDPVGLPAMLLMSWLTHVAGNLGKSDRYAEHRMWSYANIDVVLASAGSSSSRA